MNPKNFQNPHSKEVIENLKIPEGTFSFTFSADKLFEKDLGGIIYEIVAGEIYYRLEKDNNVNLKYYRSSPGTGTKVATVNISDLSYSEGIRIFMTWKPENISLHITNTTGDKKVLTGEGENSNKKFRVAPDGGVIQIGDDNVQTMGFEMYVGGKPFIQPTARDNWQSKVDAINLLFDSKSKSEEKRWESVITNMALVIMVTGFESYCKTRFLEMEKEGKTLNFSDLLNSFSTKLEKENNIEEYIIEKARENNVSPLKYIVDKKRIDFQNFKRCNTAFKKGYNISFFENLNIPTEKIDLIKEVIKYRHRIVHYSMYEASFNMEDHSADPIFVQVQFGRKCLSAFEDFVIELHNKTF
ncbi:HEPN domain-containing protein [Christiangramia fulva]|uniref:HEPN domain-containing protein n=1 Tax=Christiangramia fulva TaxID=2126553 RepID=UPI00131AF6D5|nr:HEPN domain-containing protein [Christiangramia fulva]